MFTYSVEEDDPDGQIHLFQGPEIDADVESKRLAARDWSIERFGEPGPASLGARWNVSRNARFFWFRDEMDAFEFRLRWC
jgi:hypothetical protein